MVTYSCAQRDVSTALAWDMNNGPLANYVPASSPCLRKVEACFINIDELMKCISRFQFKYSLCGKTKHINIDL